MDPSRIMLNHGIHGVQDFACMLRRMRVPFQIAAGHVTESNVLERAADFARAAYASRVLQNARILRIGEPFAGMGDFYVPDDVLHDVLGPSILAVEPDCLIGSTASVSEERVDEEIRIDRGRYNAGISQDVHRRSVRLGLGLRHYLEEGRFDAFSFNFLAFDSPSAPIRTVPFLEASKAMARGLGYAGEGDTLTAGLVAALNHAFGKTTFTEIFCPDWQGNSLFISHMGEINPSVSSQIPLLCEKDFPWTNALKSRHDRMLAGARSSHTRESRTGPQ